MRPILITIFLSCVLAVQAKDADSAMNQDIRKFLKLTNVAELS